MFTDIRKRTSENGKRTTNNEHRKSKNKHQTSENEQRTTNNEHRISKNEHQTSENEHRKSDIDETYRNRNQYKSAQIKAKRTLIVSSAFISTFFFLSSTCHRIIIQTMSPRTMGIKMRNIRSCKYPREVDSRTCAFS